MTQPTSFAAALESGGDIILDGAMGTELARIGRKIGDRDWVASTLGSADDVRRIHAAYAAAGAQVHTANTFATARHVLADVGLEDRFAELNRELVRICRESVEGAGPCWVAGSISTYVVGSDRANLPAAPELRRNIEEHAALLAEAGCDLILLEMLFDVEVTRVFIEAAATAGLPISVGLTCGRLPGGEIALAGAFRDRPHERIPLDEALPPIIAAFPEDLPMILTIMHSDLRVTDKAVAILARHWKGPVGVYPNSGHLLPPDDWDHDSVCPTEDFLAHTAQWRSNGARIVGGCCGVGPAHIEALATRVS